MATPGLAEVLLAAGNANKEAEDQLIQYEATNYAEFVVAMGTMLATEGGHLNARQLAGLQLKNVLVARDDELQKQKHDKWKALEVRARTTVKAALLTALQSPEKTASHTAAQAAAAVATVELPHGEWPEFVPTLLENITAEQRPDLIKLSSLECLGYTCERLGELGADLDENTTNSMLTAIVDGVQKTRPDEIRKVAVTALRNSLYFTRSNMEKKAERDTIMNNICEATQSPSRDVRKGAFECISLIAELYYDKLSDYMTVLYQLTTEAIRNDEEQVAIQAIEFWNVLCENEIDLLDEATELGMPPEQNCNRYIAAAVEHLGPLLLETLTKQDENEDADDEVWNITAAASSCLTLVSQTIEDLVIPVVLPFVTQNIQSENWRLREASIMAFASILEGTTGEGIGKAVNESIPVLLSALSDPHPRTRNTAAFAIAKICELHVRNIPSETFPTLVKALVDRVLQETPRTAFQSCSAIHNLATALRYDEEATKSTGTNALSQYMPGLFETLLKVADRPDAGEYNLRVSANETISNLIEISAADVRPVLLQLLPVVLERFKVSFAIATMNQEERDTKDAYQGSLCGLVQSFCNTLTREEFLPYADQSMALLLQVLQGKSSLAHFEAYSAISAVADKMEADFEKYMPSLQPLLIVGLKDYEAYQVCSMAVGLVGDVVRALESKILPYCTDIMNALVEALKDASLHRSVKPPVLAVIGEVALAIGAAFQPYFEFSVMLLLQASNVQAPADDVEMIEYVNSLRESILEAYSGIIVGLKDGNRLDLLSPYIGPILTFLQVIAADPNRNEAVLNRAVGLVGDIASLGPQVKDQIKQDYVARLLNDGQQAADPQVVDTANWAGGLIQSMF